MSTADRDQVSNFNASVEAFTTSLVLNVLIGSAFITAFVLIRPFFPFVYSPKISRKILSWKSALKGPPISVWLPKILSASDELLLERGGVNGFVAFAFCRIMLKLFAILGLICLPVLIPVNATGSSGLEGLGQFTMGNVSNDDYGRLVAHLVFSFIVNGSVLYAATKLLQLTIKTERAQFTNQVSSLGRRSILIRDIPKSLVSESALRRIFQVVGPVTKVALVKRNEKLSSLVQRAESIRESVEKGSMIYLRKVLKHQRKKHARHDLDEIDVSQTALEWDVTLLRPRRRKSWFSRTKVDWISDDVVRYKLVSQDLERERRELEVAEPESAAFIVFENEVAANLALRAVLLESSTLMSERHIVLDSDNIVWPSLRLGYLYRIVTKVVGNAAVVGLVLLWAVIVAAISSLASLDSIYKLFPMLEIIEISPAVRGFLIGFLPTVAVAIVLSLIPIVLRLIARLEGLATVASIERSVFLRYYFFLTFNVLLIVTVSKTVLDSIPPILNNPLSTIPILAESIPPASAFYINYTMLQAFVGPTSALLLIGALILRSIQFLGVVGTNTPRSMKNVLQPNEWDFPATMAVHGLIATIGVVYATLSSLVLPFVILYFLVWTVAHMYLIQRVNTKNNHAGTNVLFLASMNLFVGIYIAQLTLAGLFALHGIYVSWILMIIQFAFTAIFHFYKAKYGRIVRSVPVVVLLQRSVKPIPPNNIGQEVIDEKQPTMKSVAMGVTKQIRNDFNNILKDMKDLLLWRMGLRKDPDDIVASEALLCSNEENKMRTPENIEPEKLEKDKIVHENESLTMDIAGCSESVVNDIGFKKEGVNEDESLFVHPAARPDAISPVWIPSKDPLNILEDNVVPELTAGGIQIRRVDAQVDWEGKLVLGTGMIKMDR